jgi:sugar lactone lactonase YvrE
MMDIEHILDTQDELGEGPLWDAERQVLYHVDWSNRRFFRYDPATGQQETFEPGVAVGSLAPRSRGGLVLASKLGFAFWDFERSAIEHIADPRADQPQSHFNDGKVDRQGRFWAGTNSNTGQPTGALYRLDPDLSVKKMESGITISNGIGWSPDNKTMYYTDSPKRVIYAYDFDPTTGEIANRRHFAYTPDAVYEPDGLTVDSEGFIWSARWGGWCVARYDPDGKVEREIKMPVEFTSSCAFGGTNLDELYVTSARVPLNEAQRAQRPLDGGLFRIHVGIKGIPEPEFLG